MNNNNQSVLINLLIGIVITIISVFAINYFLDPYNFNKTTNLYKDINKEAYRFNERLFKLKKFQNNLSENILIGNSVIDDIKVFNFKKVNISNISYGGGSVEEIYQTFEFVTQNYEIKNIILGVSLSDYDEGSINENLNQTIKILNNKFLYYFNLDIFTISLKIILNKFKNKKNEIILDKINYNENIWKNIYNYQKNLYKTFKISDIKLGYLKKIINISKEKNINLIIILVPMHIEIIETAKQLVDKKYFKNFYEIINSNKKNINYFNRIKFNSNIKNFKDPLHLSETGIKKLIPEIEKNLVNTN